MGGKRVVPVDQTRRAALQRRRDRMGAPRRAQPVGGGEQFHSRLIEPFDENGDASATGETRAPRHFVRHAKLEQARSAIDDDVERGGDHVALDAARGHGAEEASRFVDDEMRTKRPWRRAESLDHGRDGDAGSGAAPTFRLNQYFGFLGQPRPSPAECPE